MASIFDDDERVSFANLPIFELRPADGRNVGAIVFTGRDAHNNATIHVGFRDYDSASWVALFVYPAPMLPAAIEKAWDLIYPDF